MRVADSTELVLRVVLAVTLIVGFYALALTIAGALLWLAYVDNTLLGDGAGSIRLTIGCVVMAAMVVYAVRPRRDHFVPQGPRLDPTDHPALFALIQEVAAAARQRVPDDVYVTGDLNASVAQRGGTMGIGGSRIMSLGLPLIQALTVGELRAVIAHEFGHYSGGDVALGPWIYKTRRSIALAVEELESSRSIDSALIGRVFDSYGRLFLRVTMAVSRRQEFTADRVAARITSPATAARALRRIDAVAPFVPMFLEQELRPAVQSGFLPPIAAGFSQFLNAPRIQDGIAQRMADIAPSDAPNVNDSHPPLADRLAALSALGGGGDDDGALDRPATDLLIDSDNVARALLVFSNGEPAIARLRRIDWDAVPERVHLARWRELAATFARQLSAVTFDALPASPAEAAALGRGFVQDRQSIVDRDAAIQWGKTVVAAAMTVTLADMGWQVAARPGERFVLVRGGERLAPFVIVDDIVHGRLPRTEWQERCAVLNLTGCPLSTAGAAQT